MLKKLKLLGKLFINASKNLLDCKLKGGEISKKADDREISSHLGKIDMHTYYVYDDLHTFFFVLVYSRVYNNSKSIKESIEATKKFIKLLKPFEKIGLFLNG
jgi:hypothetical protein